MGALGRSSSRSRSRLEIIRAVHERPAPMTGHVQPPNRPLGPARSISRRNRASPARARAIRAGRKRSVPKLGAAARRVAEGRPGLANLGARENGVAVACDWLLIDGSSLIFRAYYGVPPGVRASDGLQVNAIRGFLERLGRLIVQRRPRYLVVADDWAWRPGWRVDLIPTYKSHRVAEPVPAGLAAQIPVIYDLLEGIGIDFVGVPDHEAEDVIATLSKLAPGTVEIASGDRDLFALVENPRVRVLYPDKSGLAVIDEDEVTRRYGIPGRRYADFAILRGDPSDGLPGLKGVGSVTAAGMIRRYGDIAGVLREKPLSDADRAYLASAIRAVLPVADLPIDLPPGRRHAYPANQAAMQSLAAQYGVRESALRLLAAVVSLAPGRGEPVDKHPSSAEIPTGRGPGSGSA